MERRPDEATNHAPPSLPRSLSRAAAALLMPCLLGVLLRMGGAHIVVVLVATITVSIFGIFVGVRSLVGSRTGPGIAAVLIFTVVPFVAMNLFSEARMVGLVMRVPTAGATGQPLAAGFVFTDDAAPRADFAEVVTVVDTWSTKRGSGRRQDTYVVAPVAPASWTPDQRVHVVAIAASRHELSTRVPDSSPWSQRGGVLRALDEELQSRAVREALQRRGLSAVGNVVIGTWVPSPGVARLQAALPGLALVGVALVVWACVLLIDRREGPKLLPSGRR